MLSRSEEENRILITEYKDVGNLVCRLGRPSPRLVLFRTETSDPHTRLKLFQEIIERFDLHQPFVVAREDRLEVRKL